MWTCPTCGSTNETEWKTCIICGTSRDQARAARVPQKESVTLPVQELLEEEFPPLPSEQSTVMGQFADLPEERSTVIDGGMIPPAGPPERQAVPGFAAGPAAPAARGGNVLRILVVLLALVVAGLAVTLLVAKPNPPAPSPVPTEPIEPTEPRQDVTSLTLTRTEESRSRFTRLQVIRAVAGSELVYQGNRYQAGFAVDGDLATSWQEGVSGLGEQESLTLFLDGEQELSMIRIACGNHYSDYAFTHNSRPKTLRFVFSDGTKYDWEFEDKMEIVQLKLAQPVRTSYVQIILLDAYDGEYQDTGISEVELYR